MHPEAELESLAVIQGGVVTRRQVLAAGVTDRQISYRIRTGRWSRVATGGYRAIDMSGRKNLLRAATTMLPECVASHFSAAALHGLAHVDTRTVSVTVHSRTTHVFPGVRVLRAHDLAPQHCCTVDGISTTSVARTIVDLAAVVHHQRLRATIDDAIASRKTTAPEIEAVLGDVARRGKPGVRVLRAELENWIGGSTDETVLEGAGNRLLANAGIEGWETQYSIPWSPNKRFDVALPKSQVAIEWDSRRWHAQGQALEADRERDAAVQAHGWRILRFTWSDVHDRPGYVIDTIRAVLALT
jgi:very-short-patch-repair endonuclease